MTQFLVIISILIAIVAVIFAVQNSAPTTIKFLVWENEVPLAVGLLLAVLLGAMISLFASLPSIIRSKVTLRKQKKSMTDLETSQAQLQAKVTELQSKSQELEIFPGQTR